MKSYELSIEDLNELMWLLEDYIVKCDNTDAQQIRLQSIITNLNGSTNLPVIELESKSEKRFTISSNQ